MGHNELDQPSFTQPLMYKVVDKMTPVARKYEAQLIAEGTTTEQEVAEIKKRIQDRLEAAYIKSKDYHYEAEEWKTSEWENVKQLDKDAAKSSGVPVAHLKELGIKLSALPKDREFHR